MTEKKDVIQNNLEVGKLAKPKMYNTLLNRINAGEVLNRKELETFEALDRELREQYMEGKPESFKNVLEVEQYLSSQGWKIGKSSIYNHVRARKLISGKDGSFTKAEVDRYALANLRKADGSKPQAQKTEADRIAEEAADERRRKDKHAADLLEIRVNKEKGLLVPRDALESELAARAAIFRSDGESFFRIQAPAMVNIVNGDPARTQDLVAFCLDEFEKFLARYLQREEFTVDASAYQKIFEKADEDELIGEASP